MPTRRPIRAIGLALLVAMVVAAAIAAVGSARNADLTYGAKLTPNVVTGGEPVNYKSNFTNNKSSTTHLSFTATFPAGTTDITTLPAAPACTTSGVVVSCDIGQVAAGVTSSVEIKATTAAVSAQTPYAIDANWGFYDVKGQGGGAQSTDHADVSRTTQTYPAGDGSVSGKCLPNSGGDRGLSASKDGSSIVLQTPDLSSGLCVPVAVQVLTASSLMSFGPPFGSAAPASLVLSFIDKKAKDPLTYTPDGGGPSFVVRPCAETPITTVPACETGRKFANKIVSVSVLWTGSDPFWNM